MKIAKRIVIAVSFTLASHTANATEPAVKDGLAPTGKLRIGLVYAPAKSIYFVVKKSDETGEGVTAELADGLGKAVNLPVEQFLYANSGEAADALEAGKIDVSFMPADAARKARFDFGPAYTYADSTYMVTDKSGAKTVGDVDRADLRILAVANTSTLRSAEASLKKGKVQAAASVAEAIKAMQEGKADAFALSRDSLPVYLKQVPGSHMVDGYFQRVEIAIAVRKGNVDALKSASDFLETAREDGTVRHALDNAGYPEQPVAK